MSVILSALRKSKSVTVRPTSRSRCPRTYSSSSWLILENFDSREEYERVCNCSALALFMAHPGAEYFKIDGFVTRTVKAEPRYVWYPKTAETWRSHNYCWSTVQTRVSDANTVEIHFIWQSWRATMVSYSCCSNEVQTPSALDDDGQTLGREDLRSRGKTRCLFVTVPDYVLHYQTVGWC
jgi:hypothetical protein